MLGIVPTAAIATAAIVNAGGAMVVIFIFIAGVVLLWYIYLLI